jgi:hypothetical protein
MNSYKQHKNINIHNVSVISSYFTTEIALFWHLIVLFKLKKKTLPPFVGLIQLAPIRFMWITLF